MNSNARIPGERSPSAGVPSAGIPSARDNKELHGLFGPDTSIVPLIDEGRMGRRVHGVDLTAPLEAEHAAFLIQLLDRHNIVSFPAQDLHGFDVHDLERLANHFGAVIPHPKNYANYNNKTNAELVLQPVDKRSSTQVNQAFPGDIECAEGADSAGVYVVSNLIGSGREVEPEIAGGQHWHTDIEFEPIPLSTSMFYVQCAPTTRDSADGNWVHNPPREPGFYHPDSSPELSERREALPLNGETAYTDTAAAYAALAPHEQRELDAVLVRRRLRPDDEGWLIPLVHTNPRNGIKSLHSPVWASRGRRIAPVEVDGMSPDASRAFLDQLECHVLQPEFRYDHPHTPGDVTIWSNFATLHVAPPYKRVVNDPADARLMYRISCKGDPCYALPRLDTDEWIAANIVPPYRTPLPA